MILAIAIEDPEQPDVHELLQAHLGFSRRVTPEGFAYALDVDRLLDRAVTLYGARRDGVLVGVGALKRLDSTLVELKSMHTSASVRRQGVGRAMVNHLLAIARHDGYERISLETGTMDDFAPARALYASMGFEPCGPFGSYHASPHNTFMTMRLR